jgi:hypothetical protein
MITMFPKLAYITASDSTPLSPSPGQALAMDVSWHIVTHHRKPRFLLLSPSFPGMRHVSADQALIQSTTGVHIIAQFAESNSLCMSKSGTNQMLNLANKGLHYTG